MDEHISNLLLRLQTLEDDLKQVKHLVGQMRDHQLSNPPCGRPNLCIELTRILEGHAQAIARLERQEIRIVTVCAIIAFGVPLVISFLR